MPYSVHKIGGSILKSEHGFKTLETITKIRNSKNAIIVSAIGKTSSELQYSLHLSENNYLKDAQLELLNIIENHFTIAHKILSPENLLSFTKALNLIHSDCESIIQSVSITREVSDKVYDRFLALGEDMALALVSSYFANDTTVSILDSRNLIKTDSNFKVAKVDSYLTNSSLERILSPHFQNFDTVIIQGFVGSDSNGITTTMGFESSNLTATIVSDFLNAYELTLWTDVDCIYTADPKIYSNAKPIPIMNYNTALIAGMAGLKLIYPDMIKIAKSKNIKLIFRNGLTINDRFTEVVGDNSSLPSLLIHTTVDEASFKSISHCHNLTDITNNENIDSTTTFDYNLDIIGINNVDKMETVLLSIINANTSQFLTKLIRDYSELLDSGIIGIESGNNSRTLNLYIGIDTKSELDKLINNLCTYL